MFPAWCKPLQGVLRIIQIQIRSSVLHTFTTSAAVTAIGLANSILLARALGASGRGELAAAMLWPPFVGSAGGLGLYTAITYFTAQQSSRVRVVIGSALACGVVQAMAGVIACYYVLPVLLHDQSQSVVASARLYLTIVPITFFSQYLQSILQGKLCFSTLNALRSIVPVGYFAGSSALLWAGRLQVRNIVMLHIALQSATLITVLCVIARMGLLSGLTADRHMIGKLLSYGSKVYAGEMTGNVNTRLDQMLLAGLFPPRLLGLYVVAVAAASGPEMLATSVRTVSTPRIAGVISIPERRAQLSRTFNRYLKVVLPFACVLALVMPWLVPLIYGQDFNVAVPATEILLAAGVVLGAAVVLGAGGQALGDPWVSSRAQIFAVPVTISLLMLMLPILGIVGAALASLGAYTGQLVFVIIGLRKHGIQWRELLLHRQEPLGD